MEFPTWRHLIKKKDMLLISIPTPCHEKWNEMSPTEQGAFCGVCSKTVVDFTSLSDEEVQNYFLSQRGQKTCGRFRNDQLKHDDDPLKRLLADSIPFWKKFLAIVLVVFSSLLTGCNNDVKGDVASTAIKTSGKIMETITLGISSSVEEPSNKLMGDTTLVEVCTATMGVTEIEPMEIREDIIAPPPPIEVVGEVIYMPKDENGNVKKVQEK
jgi:hypothetical protein